MNNNIKMINNQLEILKNAANINKNEENKLESFLFLPTKLIGFTNTISDICTTISNRIIYRFKGKLTVNNDDKTCPLCGNKMEIHQSRKVNLRHLPFGSNLSCIEFIRHQFYCNKCGISKMQNIPFKDEHHFITKELKQYVIDLLSTNRLTLKQIAELSGLGKNTVKDIDKERLKEKYTENGVKLKTLDNCSKYLGIDEFSLHKGHKYATHIIDLETGHVLWISEGKKKQVLYDFFEYAGNEWMSHVEAVACDMNSNFEEAFKEKYPHVIIVFDHFYIIKNFNDNVVNEIRKEEQMRLVQEGKVIEYKSLKNSKYILMSSRKTIKKKTEEYNNEKIISKGSQLFKKEEVKRKINQEEQLNKILCENELLFTVELIKELMAKAYETVDESHMKQIINTIIEYCETTENKHLKWFKNLIINHYDGIIAHANYRISSGKIEGINNKIKTIRRQHYGLPDDEYFFLKVIDASRYNNTTASHKICD